MPRPRSTKRGIGTLQLLDAGRLDIVGSAAIADLRAALQGLAAEPALRVLVLRGTGERAFIGGADIGEMVGLTPASAEAFITRLPGCATRSRDCRCR